ncbi:hypothetical protein GCM10017786_19430 [Amycolatopsis deserti]|uniref:VWFA domain-containing protein n=1 Tax=Amycolatopsis deserti TaxID=185696 RepID=A0ABQ3IM13_9PSEU|nr:substrate-binding domain-containing protein [Amycolatopsis deserti]GHE87740.1 hypothetical protein GCM10017786_19430 [Amycolatopsis deserti]
MGRHSSPARRRPRRAWAIAGILVLLGGAGWIATNVVRDQGGCERPVVVRVAAAPAVAPAVAQVARRVAQTECAAFEVNAVDSAAVAQSLALPSGGVRPDVWIPESTLQLRRAKGVGASGIAGGTSIASSPVVFAVTEEAAKGLGWPGRAPTWSDVLGAPGLTLGVPDPGRDPAGLSALIGVRAAVPAADAYAATLRRLSPNAVPATDELFTRLADRTLAGFPVSENALLRHNVRTGVAGTQSGLVATYQSEAPALDYPFAVLGGAGESQRAAAGALLSALLGLEGTNALADAGFRTPDGRYLRDGTAQNVSDRTLPSPAVPTDAEVDALLGQWARINSSSRARVLIDVSGSMDVEVPGTGRTRMQLTTDAAARALSLFKPTSECSVWEFATRLDGDRDYREVLPMRPVSDQLASGAAERLRAIQATPDGDTGLYDTVLAAYRLATAEWQPGRLNLVIVLTDGRNDDDDGISRDALVAELTRLADPARPVAIIGIGIGPDVDVPELTAITVPTGGQAFAAPDPARIADVFYGALAGLTGA